MYRALALKELRELWWAGAIALIIIGFQVLDAIGLGIDVERFRIEWMGSGRHRIPFLSGDLRETVVMAGYALAIGLGLWQTLGESLRGTWPFLLHRPVALRAIVLSKLAVGLALLLVSTGLPVLLYAWWAATPGNLAAPFEWWMTVPVWQGWFSATALYLAAFLCGIREARWYGSRLWPLVPALLLPPLAFDMHLALPIGTLTLVLDAVLVGAIVFAARERDYS